MGYPIQQSTANQPVVYGPIVLSSDHITAATGKTLTVTISKAGGAFASPAGAVSEVGNGYYQIAANATDSGTLGPLVVNATAAGCDPFDDVFSIVAYNPLGKLAATLAAGDVSGNLPANVQQWLGSTPDALSSGKLPADVKLWLAAAPAALSASGYVQAMILRWLTDNAAGTPNALSTGDVQSAPQISGPDTGGTTTLLGRLTAARSGYLDNLNVGGAVASHADITGLNTATAMARVITATQYLKPTAGSTSYPVELVLMDLEGQLTDADGGTITNVVINGAGTDRSSNFSAWTHVSTGIYQATYSVASGATDEPLILRFSGTIGGQAFVAVALPQVADAFAIDFNSTDRSNLTALFNVAPAHTPLIDASGKMALTTTEHTNIAADVQTGLTAQGYNTTRAGYLDTLNGLVASVWNALTSGMTTAGSIGQKIALWILGSDHKSLLSTDAQTGVTIPTVTAITNAVTVGGYAAGEDPASLLLVTPANKIATDGSGFVTITSTDQAALAAAMGALEVEAAAGGQPSIDVIAALKLAVAGVCGQTSGMGTNNVVIQNPAGTKNRVTGTADLDGNRGVPTVDLT